VRILFIHNSADIYGASRSLMRLCGRLDPAKFCPVVLLPEEGPLSDILRGSKVEVHIFPSLRVMTRPVLKSWKIVPWLAGFLPSTVSLANILRRERISLVHTNTGVICSSALAAKIVGVPHVWHIRDWFQEFGPLWKPYSRYILALSDRVLCVSTPIAGQFPPSPKITVLNNGFDLAEFPKISPAEKAAARQRFGLATGDLIVGTVGRIKFVRKGQEFLLKAAALLNSREVRVKVLLVGGAAPGAEDQMEKMKRLASELGIASSVVFAGELTDPRAAYAAMDIFVLPSAQPEPFGGVVMEAMALGLPVIGTAIGGTTEQISDRVTGLLVPPADAEALAAAILRLLDDPSLRLRMGVAARDRIANNFSLDGMVEHLKCIYESHIIFKEKHPRL